MWENVGKSSVNEGFPYFFNGQMANLHIGNMILNQWKSLGMGQAIGYSNTWMGPILDIHLKICGPFWGLNFDQSPFREYYYQPMDLGYTIRQTQIPTAPNTF